MPHDHDPPSPGPEGPVFVLHDRIADLHPHPETSHTEHGLTYLVDGWFELEHGRAVRADPGTITVIPAGVPHRPIAGRGLDCWLVGFCASCLRLDERQLLMSPFRRVRRGALPVVSIARERRRKVLWLCRALREECARDTADAPELARSLLLLLLGEVRRAMASETTIPSGGSLVADALEVIQRRCLEPISLRDVAAAVHRSPAHVAASVKQQTGYTVGEWIRAGRIAEAAARLLHTDDALEQIAIDVGWGDKTHFIRQFRKVHGITPAAWRRDRRGGHGGASAGHARTGSGAESLE